MVAQLRLPDMLDQPCSEEDPATDNTEYWATNNLLFHAPPSSYITRHNIVSAISRIRTISFNTLLILRYSLDWFKDNMPVWCKCLVCLVMLSLSSHSIPFSINSSLCSPVFQSNVSSSYCPPILTNWYKFEGTVPATLGKLSQCLSQPCKATW